MEPPARSTNLDPNDALEPERVQEPTATVETAPIEPEAQVAQTAPLAAKKPISDFTEKLILMLVEKFALALLLVAVGYFVSKSIEGYKAFEARRVEAAKKGLLALDVIWQDFRKFDEASRLLLEAVEKGESPGTRANEARAARGALETSLLQNEIWLPPVSFQKVQQQMKTLVTLTDSSSSDGNAGRGDQIKEALRAMKQELLQTPTAN